MPLLPIPTFDVWMGVGTCPLTPNSCHSSQIELHLSQISAHSTCIIITRVQSPPHNVVVGIATSAAPQFPLFFTLKAHKWFATWQSLEARYYSRNPVISTCSNYPIFSYRNSCLWSACGCRALRNLGDESLGRSGGFKNLGLVTWVFLNP